MSGRFYLTKSSTFPAKKCKTNDPLHSKLVLKPKSDHAHLHAHDTISARLRLAITSKAMSFILFLFSSALSDIFVFGYGVGVGGFPVSFLWGGLLLCGCVCVVQKFDCFSIRTLRRWRWLVSRRRFRDRFLSRSGVPLMALKWVSAVFRCLSTIWWYTLISPSIFRRHTLPDCVDRV